MRKIGVLVLIALLTASLFSAPYIFAGLDIDGHIFPFVGMGMKAGDGYFNFSLGITYDEGAWAFITKSEYFFITWGVEYGGSFAVISAFPGLGEAAGFNVGPDNFLFLMGGKLGYVIRTMGVDLDLSANLYFTLPFGATTKITGPIPFFSLSVGQEK